MAEFPAAPVSPQHYFDLWLPAALAEAGALPGAGEAELSLGFCLEGAGGGAWACRLRGGLLSVRAAPAADCACDITYIQRAADWQAAVWAGRGGALGAAAARLFRTPAELPPAARRADSAPRAGAEPAKCADSAAPAPRAGAAGGTAWLRALAGLRKLDGQIRLAITGGAGDWELALRLGPGPIPARRTCALRASANAADALARGELAPLSALLRGHIEVQGDMKLLLRLAAHLRRA
ncbi:MAG: SCP2 sterol-binding domain-containing protein [Deltaproteobacteria bacterium]|nr:SCP2 sterol-binding domain-containing protein [Deltaproteobacteria bacterium]